MIGRNRRRGLSALLLSLAVAPRALAQEAPPSPSPSASQDARTDLVQAALEATPGGLTADDVVVRAIETSPQLTSAGLTADKAAQNKKRAQLAFAPRVDLRAQYTRLSEINLPTIDFNGTKFAVATQVLNQYYTQASVALPITDFFLTILPTYRGATRAADVAKYQRDAIELQVSYDARVAFYEFVRARGQLLVTEDAVGLLEAHVKDLKGLVGAGVSTQTDLMRAEAELANARAMRTQMQGAVAVAALHLTQLVGSPVEASRAIGEPLVASEIEGTPELAEVLSNAQTTRPELKALRALGEVREDFASARKGAQWPQVRATGNVYYANPHPRFFPQKQEWDHSWDVGVQLVWSPNDTVYAHTQATDALTDIELARQDLRSLENGVELEAAAAVTGHRAAREQVASSMQGVEAARRRYADQRSLMLAGAATPNDVLEAENLLRRAELMWIDAFIQARIARAALMKSQGHTGLDSGSRSAP